MSIGCRSGRRGWEDEDISWVLFVSRHTGPGMTVFELLCGSSRTYPSESQLSTFSRINRPSDIDRATDSSSRHRRQYHLGYQDEDNGDETVSPTFRLFRKSTRGCSISPNMPSSLTEGSGSISLACSIGRAAPFHLRQLSGVTRRNHVEPSSRDSPKGTAQRLNRWCDSRV